MQLSTTLTLTTIRWHPLVVCHSPKLLYVPWLLLLMYQTQKCKVFLLPWCTKYQWSLYSRVSHFIQKKHQMWWHEFYHPFFLFHSVQSLFFIFFFLWHFFLYQVIFGDRLENISECCFWYLILSFLGRWTQHKKTAALYEAPFLKKSRKTARNWPFLPKNALLTIFRQFFPDFFKNGAF